MKKIRSEKVMPTLPEGMKVSTRPHGLEFMQRGSERWVLAIQVLSVLEATQCLQIEVKELSKLQIGTMKTSIKRMALKLEHKGRIRFAVQEGILYVWSNRKEA